MHIYTLLKNRLSSLTKTARPLIMLSLMVLTVMQAMADGRPVHGRPVHKRIINQPKKTSHVFAIPVNDELCGAINIVPSAACAFQTYSNVDGSASPNTPLPTCENFTDADVWFKFTVPAGATQITLDAIGGTALNTMADGGASIYSFTGTNCSSYTLTQLACDGSSSTSSGADMPKITLAVTAGQTYYIRFWGLGGEQGSFGLCVSANIPPANDNCSSATNLTVNPNYACAAITAGTTTNATQSTEGGTPTCGNTAGINDDVWYTFTATSVGHRIVLSNIIPAATAMTMQVYTGTCAGGLTPFAAGCSTTGTLDLTGLTAGTVYTVRVYTNVATTLTANFNICVGTAPPPPPNDNCATPTNLTVNTSLTCTTTAAGTTESATVSPAGVPAPSCGNAAGANDDVWYTFTATGPTHWITLSNIVPAATAMTFTVYSGTCAGFTEINCTTNNGPSVITGLITGNVYYVRVYTNVATVGTSATFNICVSTPPPAPGNDNCTAPISLTVNPDLNCGVVTAGTTASATPSAGAPTPTCGTVAGVNDDVWYSFQATGTVHWVSLSNVTPAGTAMTFSVYSGTCAGGLTLVTNGCSTTGITAVTGLTSGQIYLVRVYTDVATATTSANFTVCVGTPVPPPNDDCPNPVNLTVNPNYNCGITTPGTTSGATQSTTTPTPTCSATGINDDVWFTFTATGTGHRVSLSNILPAGTAMSFQVYSGTCAGGLTAVPAGCSTTGTLDLTGLTSGQVYYVRVYTTLATLTTIATFNVCVGTAPPPPPNDDCANAISLTVNPSTTCTTTTPGYTYSATQSPTTPLPTCGTANGYNDDVWYTFVATQTNHRVSLLNVTGSSTVMNTAVYSGTNCSNLTLFQCQPGVINNLYGLTPGNTYWVRVWTDLTGISNAASYDICVSSIPPPSAGTLCSVSSPFCTTSQPAQSSPTGQPSLGQFGCLLTTPNPTWYVLQVANPGTLVVNIHQQTTAGADIDVDYAVWGPFTSVADGCSQIAPTTSTGAPMVSCSYSIAAIENATIPNAQTGQFYIMLVTNFNGAAGTITFTPGVGNVGSTNCSIVCNATATNNGPVCPGGTFNLTGSTTVTGATYGWTGPGGFTSNVQNPTGVVAPSTTGSYNYTLTVTVGANSCTSTTTVVVLANPTMTLTSAAATANQTVCAGTPITNITYSVVGATNATATNLPAGVTGTFAGGVFTISGTPTVTGVFNYTVTTAGGCATPATQNGTITVTAGASVTLTSAAGSNIQSVCIGTPITNILYTTGNGATGANVTGLPAGVTGTYSGGTNGTVTISGTPTASGVFNYTVITTGGCGAGTLTGTITVTNATIVLTSPAATANQTVCINTAITNIVYTSGNGATNVTVTGLPLGVTGTYSGGTNGTFTITGTPTAGGTYNYTVQATGCGTASLSGTIIVSTISTLTLTSAPATTSQTPCINTLITPITYAVGGGGTGATVSGLPAGVTGTFAAGVFTISGTPTVAGPFIYTVTATGGCGLTTATGTITVRPATTIALTSGSANQTVCINTAIGNIVYTSANGATNVTVTGLPGGVTGTYSGGTNGTFTISGTPSVSGTFNYQVSTVGGCGVATLSGTITVNASSTLTLTSAAGTNAQTICINTAIAPITYSVGGVATGASASNLPAGVTGTFAGGVFTISGTPTVSGTFNYIVTTSGGCGTATANGTITVSPATTVVLTSAAATANQTLCINMAITTIVYTTGNGATGATVVGLPAGVTGTYSGGTNGTVTISGIPTVSGTFNYGVVTSGGCATATLTGTITVNPLATITLTSAAGTNAQTVCISTPITNITYTPATGGTGLTVSGLPAGVTGVFAGGTMTISGTPSVAGTFNYTLSTTGGCGIGSATGVIIVRPLSTITLTSAAATAAQTICQNSSITSITYTVGGSATGATITGLPSGVNGVFNAGVFTISGTAASSGVFNYTVTPTGGCGNATRTGTITVSPALTANAGPNVTIAAGTTTQLNGQGTAGASYLWTANGPLALTSATILNPIANPMQTTTYTLTVSDANTPALCPSASSSMVVTVVTSCINVRNAFTPNGDGMNDTWYVYDQNFCLKPNVGVTVNVYNRYGNKVFASENYTNTWDGTYKGKPVPDGTYFAVVEFTLQNGFKQVVKTDVTVLR